MARFHCYNTPKMGLAQTKINAIYTKILDSGLFKSTFSRCNNILLATQYAAYCIAITWVLQNNIALPNRKNRISH